MNWWWLVDAFGWLVTAAFAFMVGMGAAYLIRRRK